MKKKVQVTEQVDVQVDVQVEEVHPVPPPEITEISIDAQIATLAEEAIDAIHVATRYHPGYSLHENATKANNRSPKAEIIYSLINKIKKLYEQ